MKFLSTKKIRALIIGALILTIGTVGLSICLNSAALRNVVLERVNAALDGRIDVAGHRLSLLSGRLVLTGVRLERPDNQPLAEIGRMEVRVAWAALLKHTLHVSLLALDKVRLVLEFDDQGRLLRIGPSTGSQTPEASGRPGAPWRVVVDQCRLDGGTVIYRRSSRKWAGEAANIQLTASLDSGDEQGNLRLAAGPLIWRGGEFPRTLNKLNIALEYNGPHPSTLVVETGRSRLEAKGRLNLEGSTPALELTADLDLALDEVGSWVPDIRLEGQAAARLAAHGPVDDPEVDFHVTLPRGKLAGIAVAPLKADLNYARGRLTIGTLHAREQWGVLDAAGVIDPAGGKIDHGAATLISPDLAALGTALGVEMPFGSGRLQLNCSGPWMRPSVRAQLLAQGLKWRQYALGRLVAAAELDAAGKLTFSHLVLENQGSLAEGRGGMTLKAADGQWRADPGMNLTLEIKNLEPADFGLDLPAQAVVGAGIEVSGTVRHLHGKATLTPGRLRWNDRELTLRGSAVWDDGRLNVSELSLSKDAAELQLQGEMKLRDPRSGRWLDAPLIEAGLRSRNVRLQDFFPDYSGELTLEARVEGTPADLKGGFQLTGSDLELSGQPLSAAVVKGRLTARKVYLDIIDMTVAAGQEIRGRGWYGFDRSFELTLDSAGIGLDHIPSLQRAYSMEGLLVLALKGRGTLQNPMAGAEVTIRRPRLNHQPWDDFHLRAKLEGRRLELDADLNFTFRGSARLDSGDFDLTARLTDAELSPYLAMAGGAQWGGRLSARLQAGGNWNRPRDIRADLDISDALLRYQSLDLLKTRHLRARIRDGRVELSPSRLDLMQNGFLNLSASGDLRKDLRMGIDGRLPLSALAPFSDALGDARGALTLHASTTGAIDGLQWQADVGMADIALDIPGLEQTVRELNGRIRLTSDELKVEQVSGRMDNGRFDLSGAVALADWKPAGGRLEFKAQSLPLQWPDTMDVVLNGDLILAGTRGNNTLAGRLVLLEGTYYKDVRLNLLSAVGQPRRAEPVPATYELPPALADIGLNISFGYRYPFLVDNNLARLQVAPDLRLTGTLGRPVLSGRAQVTEGEVIFRRKTFTVKRGVVDFINPYKIEPTLDIAAEAQIRQWLVSLNLSGTPDRLVFHLSSDPSESESDILSLILLGSTSSELSGGQRSSQSTRQMLAALVATAWGEDVKKTTGVDILEVDTGTEDTDKSADTIQLTVGKRLSRRLTLKYEVESGSEELIQRAVSEYRFVEHLLASGFQDSQGGYGGELLFRIEF